MNSSQCRGNFLGRAKLKTSLVSTLNSSSSSQIQMPEDQCFVRMYTIITGMILFLMLFKWWKRIQIYHRTRQFSQHKREEKAHICSDEKLIPKKKSPIKRPASVFKSNAVVKNDDLKLSIEESDRSQDYDSKVLYLGAHQLILLIYHTSKQKMESSLYYIGVSQSLRNIIEQTTINAAKDPKHHLHEQKINSTTTNRNIIQ